MILQKPLYFKKPMPWPRHKAGDVKMDYSLCHIFFNKIPKFKELF